MYSRDYENQNHFRTGNDNTNPMPHMGQKFPFSGAQEGNPKELNFCEFLQNIFCPNLKLMSFTSIITILNILVFVGLCIMGLQIPGTFLQIDYETLKKYGNNPQDVYNKTELWRWVSAILMHADFMHLFFNSVCILIVGSMVEQAQGFLETMILYTIAGICGNAFTAAISGASGAISVGASTAIYGLLAALVGYMILNWKAMGMYADRRNTIMCFLCLIIFFLVVFSMNPSSTNLDYNGHIGGFLGGLFFSMAIFTPFQKSEYTGTCRICGIVLGCFFVMLMLVIFYTLTF